MTDDEKKRLSQQKTKRTVMSAFLGLLVLGGAVFFLTSNDGDDSLAPAPAAMTNDLPDMAPASRPDSVPPGLPPGQDDMPAPPKTP